MDRTAERDQVVGGHWNHAVVPLPATVLSTGGCVPGSQGLSLVLGVLRMEGRGRGELRGDM